MKRFHVIYWALVMLSCISLHAQQQGAEIRHVRIVDGNTGVAMPCVHAKVGNAVRAVSNAEGDLSLPVAESDTVSLTAVGYSLIKVCARELSPVVKMYAQDVHLEGVEVLSGTAVLDRVKKNLKSEYKQHADRSRAYFFRFYVGSGSQHEMLEGVVKAKSAHCLRGMRLMAGKCYGVDADGSEVETALQSSNVHKLMSLSPMNNGLDQRNVFSPFAGSVSVDEIVERCYVHDDVYSEEGRLMHRMTFTEKKTDEVCGTAYVDATTFRIVRYKGVATVAMQTVRQKKDGWVYTSPSRLKMIVDYTYKNGFAEVECAFCEILSENVAVRCHLCAVGEENVPDETGILLHGNILEAIRKMEGKMNIKAYSAIIRRTTAEENIVAGGMQPEGEYASNANERLLSYIRNAMSFNRAIPQEKVYLHLDNTGYFENETMWFKAYLVRTDSGKPSDLSKVLYVELLNMSGDVIKTTKWPVDSIGQSNGDMTLDSLLGSGFYEVRAYTKYMTNWGANACFSRVIPVFRKPSAEGNYTDLVIRQSMYKHRDPNNRRLNDSVYLKAAEDGLYGNNVKKTISLQFYPEGGKLVIGKKSRVAVMAVDDSGFPYQSDGHVMNAADDVVANFKTDSLGRGSFFVVPDGNPCTVQMRNKKNDIGQSVQLFGMPKAEKEGCVLALDAVSDDMLATLQCSDGMSGCMLGCVIMNNGNIVYCDTMSAEPLIEIALDRSRQRAGVNQFTVFDSNGRILAERLYFVCPPKDSECSISFTAEVDSIRPCGRVCVDVRSLPKSTLSFSAMDATAMTNGSVGNMKTWMLLSSDVRGYIDNVNFYFEEDDYRHRQAADLLMLTQGWRRYDWEVMCGVERMSEFRRAEDKFYVKGKLGGLRRTDSVANVAMEAFLYNTSGESLVGTAMTDSLGRYVFEMPFVDGEWNMQKKTRKENLLKDYSVCVDRQFSPQPVYVDRAALRLSPPMEPNMVANNNMFPDSAKTDVRRAFPETDVLIGNVTVKAKRKYFTNDDWKYKNEMYGRENATLFYDIDKEREDMLDMGEEIPDIFSFLCRKNVLFGNPECTNLPNVGAGDAAGDAALDYNGGMTYAGRPIKWIVDNGETSCALLELSGRDTDMHIQSVLRSMATVLNSPVDVVALYSDEIPAACTSRAVSLIDPFFPVRMDEIRSLYIVPYSPKEQNQAVRIYIYTHKKFTTESQKGLRRTYFQGFNRPSVFKMEDYSVIPPMADFRRTIYWNPCVRTDANGRAKVEFYNNSTCREMFVSVEGMSDDGKILVGK